MRTIRLPRVTRGLGVLFLLSAAPALAHAQETSTIYAALQVSDNQLAGLPAMVTLLRDGEIVESGS